MSLCKEAPVSLPGCSVLSEQPNCYSQHLRSSPRRYCKEAAFGRSCLSTQGHQTHEDLGGNTSNELKGAGAPDLMMKEKDSGLSGVSAAFYVCWGKVHSWQAWNAGAAAATRASCGSMDGDISQPTFRMLQMCRCSLEHGCGWQVPAAVTELLCKWQKGSLCSHCRQPPWAQQIPE